VTNRLVPVRSRDHGQLDVAVWEDAFDAVGAFLDDQLGQ